MHLITVVVIKYLFAYLFTFNINSQVNKLLFFILEYIDNSSITVVQLLFVQDWEYYKCYIYMYTYIHVIKDYKRRARL